MGKKMKKIQKMIDSNLEFDDVDEFDMEELENMYKETEIDENVKQYIRTHRQNYEK